MTDSLTDWAEREQGRVRYPQYLLQESMVRAALQYPDKVALVVEGERYTYRQLLEHSSRLARQLTQLGVRRGERVAVYMDNTWPCITAIYAILMAGGVFLLVNPQTKTEKLEYILKDSGAVALISDAHLARQFIPATDALPALATVLVSGPLGDIAAAKANLRHFDAALDSYHGLPPKAGSIPNDLAALIYTSGSTGNPKGVMQTHRSMLFAAWSLLEYLRIEPSDKILLVLPLAFDYGLYQLLMAMAIGATLVVERSFTYPGQIYQRMREEEVTVFPGVPTIFSTMIAAHQKKALHFPGVGKVTNTAARLPAEYVATLKQIFPQALIFKMYGLTECKRVCYLEPELLDAKPESVGKAIPGTEVFVLSPEGEPVPRGEVGILHVRGPHVMAGYWRQPALSAEMLRPGPLPGEQILCSGDWFSIDQEGFLYFYGRSDDIIKSRGEKVSPVEVENVLHGIAGIKEAVVVGIADELLGQAVRAFVVLFPGSTLTPREVQKACAARLENFMVPKEIIILEGMPKMANDKIDRKALTAWGAADGP